MIGRPVGVRVAIATAAGVALGVGCKVNDDFVDTALFHCRGPSDCGEGWGCVRASPYATDFCASSCDESTCDGICVRQKGLDGERELCLRGCRIQEDGSTSECPGEGFSCIRVSVESDDGVCYPVDACSSTADCSEGRVCLSELADPIGDPARTTNLYCVPSPGPNRTCPARSVAAEVNDTVLCLATCAPPDTRCPPTSGCLTQLSLLNSTADVPCFPGLYGVPCEDDTNCLVGRCTDVGDAGRMCSIPCDEAARIAGGCQNLPSLGLLSPMFVLECDPGAQGGLDGGLCVTRYGAGFPCTTPDSEAYACASGFSCESFPTPTGEVRICTRGCLEDSDCNDGGAEVNFCLRQAFVEGLCLPKRAAGSECFFGNQCRSGQCMGGQCVE